MVKKIQITFIFFEKLDIYLTLILMPILSLLFKNIKKIRKITEIVYNKIIIPKNNSIFITKFASKKLTLIAFIKIIKKTIKMPFI